MKIALISLVEDVSISGLRYLSACLRAEGHDTILILLPWSFSDNTLSDYNSFLYPYPNKALEQVAEICSTSDLVGISMMTCHFDNAVHVTRFLHKRLHTPIVWGGIHPTLRPAECLEYADMVCVGEGEISLCQLSTEMSKGKPWESLSIPGIYKRHQKQSLPIFPAPIVQNLDEMPLPDYGLEHQFIFCKWNIVQLNSRLLARCLGYSYATLFSRGCPYACAYCCNNAIRKLYNTLQRKLPIRWRSVESMIQELKAAIKIMPQLEAVTLADDSFLTLPTELIRSFANRYREEIGLPLKVVAISHSVSEPKLKPLTEAGLYSIGIGIQSGSERITRELYSRPQSPGDILLADDCIEQVARQAKKRILTCYDLIVDNPWETQRDIEDTVHLCMKLKKPYTLNLFSLTFYPETELFLRARDEGIINDELNQVNRCSYGVLNRTYLNKVLAALSANPPTRVITFLLAKPVQNIEPVWFVHLVTLMFQVVKLFRSVFAYTVKGDWKLTRYLLRGVFLSRLYREPKLRRPGRGRPRFCGAPGETSKGGQD
jgi:anaerobic magnesium-protoporphyrin IX monomethyl ester cyclase